MKTVFLKKLLTVLFWTTVLVISIYYFYHDVSKYFVGSLGTRKESEKWWLIVHFSGAACVLVLGPLQFWAYFRNRFRNWHRLAGKVYIGGSIVSALMVFYLLSKYPLPGSVPSLGLLALIWLFTTIAAFWLAVRRNFHLHKQFMIRSYVCGLAFLFIRLLPVFNNYTGLFDFMEDEELRSTVYEWICWVYPLIMLEFILVWWPSILKLRAARATN
jgi:uncharacterized membrane protein